MPTEGTRGGSRWNGCPEQGEEKVKGEGEKVDLHGALCYWPFVCVCVCVCVICANGSRNNAMNHDAESLLSISLLVLLTFSNRISPGPLRIPLREIFFFSR